MIDFTVNFKNSGKEVTAVLIDRVLRVYSHDIDISFYVNKNAIKKDSLKLQYQNEEEGLHIDLSDTLCYCEISENSVSLTFNYYSQVILYNSYYFKLLKDESIKLSEENINEIIQCKDIKKYIFGNIFNPDIADNLQINYMIKNKFVNTNNIKHINHTDNKSKYYKLFFLLIIVIVLVILAVLNLKKTI